MTRFRFLFLVVIGLFFAIAPTASADEAVYTGTATRFKSTFIGNFAVYQIDHYMAEKPPAKSKQAVIDADVDKSFKWIMQRSVSSEKIRDALKKAFADNHYGDAGKINQFVSAFSADEIAKFATVRIAYSAKAKSVTITVQGGKSVTVPGADFMKGVWSIWFGVIDQPGMGDQLIAKL